jgi:hypothetical protein
MMSIDFSQLTCEKKSLFNVVLWFGSVAVQKADSSIVWSTEVRLGLRSPGPSDVLCFL